LRLAREATIAVGIDPKPPAELEELSEFHVEKMTSDEFFASSRPKELFGDRPVDLVFIDGMHLFEYALRDFFHSEALAAKQSCIVFHDCLPPDAAAASRERSTDLWTGDVWKLLVCLLDHRPDLRLSVMDVPPSGLCVVRGLNPEDHSLRDAYDVLVAEYVPLAFDYWQARSAAVLRRTTRTPEARYWRMRRRLAAVLRRVAPG
jgi:hypothetical protein